MSGKDENPIAAGKIRLDIPRLAELKTSAKSPVVSIANIPWSLQVKPFLDTSNIKQFSIDACCNEGNKSPHWSCEASVIFSLLSLKVDLKHPSDEQLVDTYNAKHNNWGYDDFIAWDKVLVPENGFIREEDGGVVVEAMIIVRRVIGLPVSNLCDFTAPQPNLTDVAVILQEKPLYVCKQPLHTFCTKEPDWGYPCFMARKRALDPENGFLREEDGGVVFEAEITVTKVIGAPVPNLCDFTAPQPNLTDVALIIDGKPLHVSKTYLAFHSPVFHSMFFSDFAEKEKKEIPLEDVKYDEFVELLYVIFPSRKPITVATVESLLRLADQFNIQVVLHSCEEFLRGPDSEEIPLAKKLLWSDQYRLASLQPVCLKSLKSLLEVKALKATKEFGEFSGRLKEELTERMLELHAIPSLLEIIAVGKIRLDVPNLAELKAAVVSPVVNIANMAWRLHVYHQTCGMQYLDVYASCDGASKGPEWSCDATVTFNLLAQKVDQKTHFNKFAQTFTPKVYGWRPANFMKWDDVLNASKGYIREDGGIVVEATIAVTKVSSGPITPLCDFAASTPNLMDIALIIGGKKVHVSKQYLALYSPVFNSMFFADFAEKDKKEVRLEDVDYDDFVELLHAIYPSHKPVTAVTVEGLLCVANFYNVSVVLRACEDFLKGPESKEIPLAKKLLLSDQYSLKYVCFNELKTIGDIRVLRGTKEFGDFSGKVKEELAERIIELC